MDKILHILMRAFGLIPFQDHLSVFVTDISGAVSGKNDKV